MKQVLWVLFLFPLSNAFAYDNHLSPQEQSIFMSAIKAMGPSTWEESGLKYKYIKAGCTFDRKECWVYAEVRADNDKLIAFCSADGMSQFSDAFDQKKNKLTDKFYRGIVGCMQTWPES